MPQGNIKKKIRTKSIIKTRNVVAAKIAETDPKTQNVIEN